MPLPFMPGEQRPGGWQALALLTQLGLSFIFSVLLSFAIGYGIDHWLSTGFFKVIFLLLGIAAGGWSCFKLLKPFFDQ